MSLENNRIVSILNQIRFSAVTSCAPCNKIMLIISPKMKFIKIQITKKIVRKSEKQSVWQEFCWILFSYQEHMLAYACILSGVPWNSWHNCIRKNENIVGGYQTFELPRILRDHYILCCFPQQQREEFRL